MIPKQIRFAGQVRLALGLGGFLFVLLAGCSQAAPGEKVAGGIDNRKAYLRLNDILPAPSFPQAAAAESAEPPPSALRYMKTARERFNEQLWAEATAALEKALQIEPKLVDARILMARAGLQQGNSALAESHLKEALKYRPEDVAVHQLLGEIAWQEGRRDEAITELRLALAASEKDRDRPERALAQLTLALALRKEGYLTAAAEALNAYQTMIEKPTPAMNAYHELKEVTALYRGKATGIVGDIESELGQLDKAVKAYQRAVAESPEDRGLRTHLALALAQAKRGPEALDVVHSLLDDAPEDGQALALLKDVCDRIGEPQRYDAELARLGQAAKSPAQALRLAEMLLTRNRTDDAIAVLRKVIGQAPDEPAAHYLLSRLLLQRGAAAEGLRLMLPQLRDHPATCGEVEGVLAAIPAGDARKQAEEEARRQSTAVGDTAPAVCFVLGTLESQDHRFDKANSAFKKAAELNKDFGPAYLGLARMAVEGKQWQEVASAASTAIDKGAATAEAYLLKGRAHDALDEFDDAEAAYLEAFRLERKMPEPLFRLGEAAMRQGDDRRAEQIYRRIVDDVDATYSPAREKLILVFLKGGKIEQAKQYYSDFERLKQKNAAVERLGVLIRLAMSAQRKQEWVKEYGAELHKIAGTYPRDVATKIEQAKACAQLADWRGALACVKAAERIDHDDIEVRELMAEIQTKMLDFDGAAETYKGLLLDRPRDKKYQLGLLDLALDQGDFQTAAGLLEKLVARDDLKEVRETLHRQLVIVLIAGKKYDRAVQAGRDWLEKEPADPVRRGGYIAVLQATGRKSQAVDVAAKWLAADPTKLDLRDLYARQLMAAERYVEAEQRILSWLANDADDAGLNLLLIDAFRTAKQWDSAIEAARTGIELSDNRASFENKLALSLRDAGRFDEVIEFCRERVGTNTSDVSAQFALMQVLMQAERFGEAEQIANRLIAPQINQRDTGREFDVRLLRDLRNILSRIYQLTDRDRQAAQQIEDLLKMAPNDPGPNNDLGYTWADAGINLDKAESMVRKAVGELPREAAYLDSLGWVLYKRGRFDEALVHLRRAIVQQRLGAVVSFFNGEPVSPDAEDAVMYDHLADTLFRAGNTAEARQDWEKSAKLIEQGPRGRPANAEERRLAERIKQKLKAMDEGKKVPTALLASEQPASRPAVSQPAASEEREEDVEDEP